MRVLSLALVFFGSPLVGCAAPSPPPEPSPYRYASYKTLSRLNTIGIPKRIWKKEVHAGL